MSESTTADITARHESVQLGASKMAEVLEHHKTITGLEKNNGPEMDVWHLLFDLQSYCEVHGVDLDETLKEMRDDRPSILG